MTGPNCKSFALPSACRLWMIVAVMLYVGGVACLAQNGSSTRPETDRLSSEQEKDLKLLMGVLSDTRIDDAKRRDAAGALLSRRWPAADKALSAALGQSTEPTTPRLIAQAIAQADDPPRLLVEPLFALLSHAEPTLRKAAASALARYSDRHVLMRLIRLTQDEKSDQAQRLAAVDALAEQYQARAVGALVTLADPAWPQPIREYAMARLAETTGISEFGYDAAAWRRWWDQVKDLPPQRWLSGMLKSLSRRKAELETDRQRLMEKTTETFNRLYRVTDEKQRPALLIEMLGDPYDPVRLLAMRIVERELINAKPIGPEVRQATRDHLTDANASVRAAPAEVLRDLADEPAAKIVTEQLLGEQDPAVRTAYLSLLARLPQAPAVESVLVLAERQAANGATAAVLVALHEARVLNAQQQARALGYARQLIEAPASKPDESVVRLLGRLAEPSDESALVELMKQGEPAVRRAAAEPFVAGRFAPEPLYAWFGDEVLGGKAIDAAAAHGQSMEMIETLFRHEPGTGELQQSWIGAMVGVAKRLNLQDLERLDAALAGQPADRSALRRAVLNTVLPGEEQPIDSVRRALLLLELAELQLAEGQGESAKALLNRLATVKSMPDEATDRLLALRIRAFLAADDVEEALKLAGQWLGRQPRAQGVVATLLLDAIDKRLADRETDQAAAMIARLQQLVGELTDRELVERLRRAKEKLRQMQSPTATGAEGAPAATVEKTSEAAPPSP